MTRQEDFLRPLSLAEALAFREKTQGRPFAGGTDLMVQYQSHNACPVSLPGPVLFLDGIDQLKGCRREGENLVVGAGTLLAELAGEGSFALEPAPVPGILAQSAADIAAPGLRNRATLGGNIVNASPAGDSLPALYALGAQVELADSRGQRRLALKDFILGPGKTTLGGQELLTAVILPGGEPPFSYWRKVGTRRANALAKLSLAAAGYSRNRRARRFSLALGAVGPRVVTSPEAEAWMEGKEAGEINIEVLKEMYEPLIRPIDDQRSTAKYRKAAALNLLTHVLENYKTYLKGLA